MGHARRHALRLKVEYIDTEHVLFGVLEVSMGKDSRAAKVLGVWPEKVATALEKAIAEDQAGGETLYSMGQMPFTPEAKKVLELAVEEATRFVHAHIGIEHLLLGLIRTEDGLASKVLTKLGVSIDAAREEVRALVGDNSSDQDAPRSWKKSKTPALDAFGMDLTELARDDRLDWSVSRPELEQSLRASIHEPHDQVVLLVGSSGVGKSALIRGLAHDIAKGRALGPLRDLRVVELDFFMMVSGTRYRGQLEERLKAVLTELRRTGDVVLVVNGFEQLLLWKTVTVGESELDADAFQIVRSDLDRGLLRFVATITEDCYNEVLARMDWVRHRVQPIWVTAPEPQLTKEILKVHCLDSEDKYKLLVSDEILDFLLEASAKAHPELNEPARSVAVLKDCLRSHYARRCEQVTEIDLSELEERIHELEKQKAMAVADQDFEKAAALRCQLDVAKEERTERREASLQAQVEAIESLTQAYILATLKRRTGEDFA